MTPNKTIVWAPGINTDLTQRYLTGILHGHLDAHSAAWLDDQDPEALIGWVQVSDSEYPDGWRAQLAAAVSPSGGL